MLILAVDSRKTAPSLIDSNLGYKVCLIARPLCYPKLVSSVLLTYFRAINAMCVVPKKEKEIQRNESQCPHNILPS